MSTTSSENSEVKIYQADKSLQSKIGTGTIAHELIERSQRVMDENNVDFTPLAEKYLQELKDTIQASCSKEIPASEAKQRMVTAVMQLKANASTFKYNLIGSLANIMLSFLENVKALDEDALEIVSAHHKTLNVIVLKKIKGKGGVLGENMQLELQGACQRYFVRRKKP